MVISRFVWKLKISIFSWGGAAKNMFLFQIKMFKIQKIISITEEKKIRNYQTKYGVKQIYHCYYKRRINEAIMNYYSEFIAFCSIAGSTNY